jgi:hypothetical protein
LQRRKGGAREESRGFYRVEPWWPFTRGLKRGVIAGALPETERERGITGGGWWSVGPDCRGEKGGGERGWAGPGDLGRLAPGCGPSGLLALSFYFFLLFSFSFVSDFCFVFFFKMLNQSDLNKIKSDHICTLKSVFKTYKPRVWWDVGKRINLQEFKHRIQITRKLNFK